MNFDLILGGSLLAVFAVLLLIGTRCSFVILALCGGNLLAENLKADIFELTTKTSLSIPGVPLPEVILLVITLLPAIIVAGHFYKSQHGLGSVTQLAPALGAVGLIVVFIQPILERSSLKQSLDNSPLWGLFETYRSYIIIYALVISLIGIMIDGKGHRKDRRHKKK